MKALLCRDWGGPESLIVADMAFPDPKPGEIAIDVKAAALNFLDTLIIQGKYQIQPPLPFSPCAEVAGVVAKAARDVRGIAPGDRVMAFLGWGGAREGVAVSAGRVFRIPEEIPYSTAATLQVAYGTALHALSDRAQLHEGETLAVLGAAGGTGQAAIEIGKLLGARVLACASSRERLEFCSHLGAHETINTTTENIKMRLRELTAGRGVDVVFDPVGGKITEETLRAMNWRGRYLMVGFASGEIPRLPLNLALLKEASILGVYWGEHVEREPILNQHNMMRIVNWAREGKIKPHIHATYRLDQAVDAFLVLARREVKGKIIFEI